MSVFERKPTSFIKTLPRGSGRIVSMVEFQGRLYVASEKGIWFLKNMKTRFVRCKFERKTGCHSTTIPAPIAATPGKNTTA